MTWYGLDLSLESRTTAFSKSQPGPRKQSKVRFFDRAPLSRKTRLALCALTVRKPPT